MSVFLNELQQTLQAFKRGNLTEEMATISILDSILAMQVGLSNELEELEELEELY